MFDFKYGKRRILFDIAFLVLYVGIYLALHFYGSFKNDDTLVAVLCLASYSASGFCSILADITPEKKIRPTVRTIGLFVLGVALYLSYVDLGLFRF